MLSLADIDRAFYAKWVARHGRPPIREDTAVFQEEFRIWRLEHLRIRGTLDFQTGLFEAALPQLPGVHAKARTLAALADELSELAKTLHDVDVPSSVIVATIVDEGRSQGWLSERVATLPN